MKKFKKGDEVKVMKGNSTIKKGWKGKILGHSTPSGSAAVEFKKDFNGHSCFSLGKQGHCWFFPESDLKLIIKQNNG